MRNVAMTLLTKAGKLTFRKVSKGKRLVRANRKSFLEKVAPDSIIQSDNEGYYIEIDKDATGVIILNLVEM